MKERPIIFSDAMVRAILEGRKTQTRRIIKPQPLAFIVRESPYGQPGDRLWVRETWQPNTMKTGPAYYYRATDEEVVSGQWKSPIFMPRAASSILLEITDVRVERVQEITREDAIAEGVGTLSDDYTDGMDFFSDAVDAFRSLWQSIHGPASWEQNPWVWAITFKKIQL